MTGTEMITGAVTLLGVVTALAPNVIVKSIVRTVAGLIGKVLR